MIGPSSPKGPRPAIAAATASVTLAVTLAETSAAKRFRYSDVARASPTFKDGTT